MYIFSIILGVVLGLATAGPVESSALRQKLVSSDLSTRNSAIEDLLWGLLDNLRNTMINGSDDVPVLDPFELDKLHLDEETLEMPNSHVTLRNITALHLSTFEVDNLSVTLVSLILQRYRITLDGRIPVLEAEAGNYDLSVNVFGGNVFGNGDMKFRIINPRVHGEMVVGIRLSITGIFLTVINCRLSFTLDAFEPQITGLFNNEVSSGIVNSFLRIFIPQAVELLEEDITEILSSTVQEIANQILRDLDLGSLLP